MVEVMRFYFARSARRHKIGKAHALAALANADSPMISTDGDERTQLHWIGEDDRGVELHIVGRPSTEDPQNFIVIIHVQPTDQRKAS